MRYFLILLLTLSFSANAFATETERSPYVEITVNGLEQVAAPLNRLADAVETLADSDKLSDTDQEKLMLIMSELKGLSKNLDNTIITTRNKISETQAEIASSIKQLIWTALISLIATIGLICGFLFFLIKRQIGPLVDSTSTTIDKVAQSVDQLSKTAEFIVRHQSSHTHPRRFARRLKPD